MRRLSTRYTHTEDVDTIEEELGEEEDIRSEEIMESKKLIESLSQNITSPLSEDVFEPEKDELTRHIENLEPLHDPIKTAKQSDTGKRSSTGIEAQSRKSESWREISFHKDHLKLTIKPFSRKARLTNIRRMLQRTMQLTGLQKTDLAIQDIEHPNVAAAITEKAEIQRDYSYCQQ